MAAFAVAGVAGMAGVAGVTAASSAQAATLGFVQVETNPHSRGQRGAPDKQWSTAWNLLWPDAYKACKRRLPNTRSIAMTDVFFYGGRPPYAVRAYWDCRDTP